jgi:hypothetical protein
MAGLLDDEELLPFFGNPNIRRQGAKARASAAKRDVNTLPDPRTYAAISGLMGTAPDEMGFSVLNPDYEGIQRVARPAFAAGTALGIAPMMGAAGFSRPAAKAATAKQQLGMFIGPTSPMFNKQMAFEATKLSKRGKTPQEIWQQTGSVKGPDGQWRQEISDDVSTMKGAGEFREIIMNAYDRGYKKTGDQLYKTTVNDVFVNNPLSQAYPELMNVETQMMPKGRTARGSLSGTSGGQILRMQETLPSNDARSTMLHELQHAIQEREGFAVGGNTRDFAAMRAKAIDQIGELNTQMSSLAKQLENKALPKAEQDALRAQYDQAMETRQGLVSNASIDPMQAYGNLMGEAEARLTQRRRNLNPQQRRENFPFEYTGETGYGLDVQPSGLIYMDQSGTILDRGLLGN